MTSAMPKAYMGVKGIPEELHLSNPGVATRRERHLEKIGEGCLGGEAANWGADCRQREQHKQRNKDTAFPGN